MYISEKSLKRSAKEIRLSKEVFKFCLENIDKGIGFLSYSTGINASDLRKTLYLKGLNLDVCKEADIKYVNERRLMMSTAELAYCIGTCMSNPLLFESSENKSNIVHRNPDKFTEKEDAIIELCYGNVDLETLAKLMKCHTEIITRRFNERMSRSNAGVYEVEDINIHIAMRSKGVRLGGGSQKALKEVVSCVVSSVRKSPVLREKLLAISLTEEGKERLSEDVYEAMIDELELKSRSVFVRGAPKLKKIE